MVSQRVAIVSSRPQLAAEISRLCAIAGHPVEVASAARDVARVCRAALVTVVDDGAADALGELVGGHCGDVVVVTEDADTVSAWQAAVRLGARRVVSLPDGAAELLDVLAMAGERPGPPGPLIGVLGGSGGAGASTLAVALARELAGRDAPVTLVDLDAAGGGLDLALGLESASGLRWPELADARGVVASAALREQLPSVAGIAVVSAESRSRADDYAVSPLPDRRAVASVIDAGRRGGAAVVVDLPRSQSELADAVVATCTTMLVVVRAEVRAVAAATSVVRRLRPMCDDLRVVVRVDPRSRLRDRDVVAALGLAHVATVHREAGVTAATDRADLLKWLRGSRLARAAKTIADEIVPVTSEKKS